MTGSAEDKTAEQAGTDTRCGYVALIGAPNAGKSTLVNRLVGAKVSIVTHKIQTTRAIVRGIVTDGDTQLVLVDTPGIFAPRRRLDEAMVDTAWSGARDADLVAVLVDAERGLTDDFRTILESVRGLPQKKALIINKIDRVRRDTLLEIAAGAAEICEFDAVFMVSALNGDGCLDFLDWMKANTPAGPWLFPADDLSDAPLRLLAAEITREKLYLRLHDELPYSSHVETEAWTEREDGSVRIDQTIYVERDSQKRIVVGKNGAAIKAISQSARKELADMLGRPVHLFLFVKVRGNWAEDPERYRQMGLEFRR